MKHNKKRNTYLLYEFLSRHYANSVINRGCHKTIVSIIKNHFSGVLKEELNLFRIILKHRDKNQSVVCKILDEIKRYSSKLNNQELDNCKSALIHDINKNIGNIYHYKINRDDYKLYANIQQFLNLSRSSQLNENIEIIDIKNLILNQMSQPQLSENNVNHGYFEYLNAVEMLHGEIQNLDENQRAIVLKYVNGHDLGNEIKTISESLIKCQHLADYTDKLQIAIDILNNSEGLRQLEVAVQCCNLIRELS